MALTYTFTSKSEIIRLVSENGTQDWVDDLLSDTSAFTDVIEFVTLDIRSYTDRLYTDSDIYNNSWIRRIATIFAAYELSTRRGDPGIYGSRKAELESRLIEISEGNGIIPGAPQSAGVVAVMQNTVIDNRFNVFRNRVSSYTSSDTTGSQMLTYAWPFEWMW